MRFKVCDLHGPILSVGCFTEMHDDRTAWLDGYEMKLMKQNRRWALKCQFQRSFPSHCCVWKSKYLIPVSGPMAAVPVVPGGLASNADVEAVSEPDGVGGIEVGMDLVELGTRGPETLSDGGRT